MDTLYLPVVARADSARPHDSRVGKLLLHDALPHLPRAHLVLVDHGCCATAYHAVSNHGVMFEVRGWDVHPPEGFRAMWRVKDAFARRMRGGGCRAASKAARPAREAWLKVACVGLLLAGCKLKRLRQ